MNDPDRKADHKHQLHIHILTRNIIVRIRNSRVCRLQENPNEGQGPSEKEDRVDPKDHVIERMFIHPLAPPELINRCKIQRMNITMRSIITRMHTVATLSSSLPRSPKTLASMIGKRLAIIYEVFKEPPRKEAKKKLPIVLCLEDPYQLLGQGFLLWSLLGFGLLSCHVYSPPSSCVMP